ALFDRYEIETFDEIEEEQQTPLHGPRHWHVFDVIARKRE
ncbi:MAG: SAM-dependent methyltransferase, partial [Chloroflexi bacterium]|nr:SAM-dependent methyltransferase [Chloroflexota bacterium]